MKKLLGGILIFFLIPLISAQICSDTNEIDLSDIPCTGLTNVITCTIFEDNVTVFNINTSTQTNLSTDETGGGRFNFTFNFSEGSYSLIDCANNTATVLVGIFEQGFGISLFVFLIPSSILSFVFMFISGKINKNKEREEEETNKKTNRITPTIILLFSFIPMILMIRVVEGYLTEYLPSANVTTFYGFYYVFFSYIFYFIALVSIIVWAGQAIEKRKINMGLKEWT